MKILEICPYSAGVCGVWSRVREESLRLTKNGHEVQVYSSNHIKGSKETAPFEDSLGKVKIKRFSARKLGGESFMYWNFKKEALVYNPDVIFVHNYRHLHTTQALAVKSLFKKIGKSCKVFLVTHAPFVEGNITRTKIQTLIVNIYDFIIGQHTLNRFDKVITISHWEEPFLLALGLQKEKIVYIPNGIPEEFFTTKESTEKKKLLFLGRISPKKKIETLIEAMRFIKDKNIKAEIIGPQEEPYASSLHALVKEKHLEKRVLFIPPIYNIKEKINAIDSSCVFILPSRVEGMPQALIEAMARGKIVIGSDSLAIHDIIKNNKNGYLFEFDNPKDLAKKIDYALINNEKNALIKKNAVKFVEQFNWKDVVNKLNKIITDEKSDN